MNRPEPYGIYKHYKGDLYMVEGIAVHSETDEQLVVYRALYGDAKLYCRPLTMWFDEVDKNGQKFRFELQEIESKNQKGLS